MTPEEAAVYANVEGQTVRLTHLSKALFPEDGITKAKILDYYTKIAPVLLPHLRGRPITMKAFPHGIHGRPYYRRQLAASTPTWVSRVEVEEGPNPVIANLADLLWIVNHDAVELHPWLSRVDDLLHPDQILFDLDPGAGVPYSRICEGATRVKAAMDQLGVDCHAKTSGGKGMHLLVGFKPVHTFHEVHTWVIAVARVLASREPTLFTMDYSKERRAGRILLDHNQVGYGRTTASLYSLRPFPGAPVSAPVTWKEVAGGKIVPEQFTLRTMIERVEAMGDVAEGLLDTSRPLPDL